jgi:hypothetical protein
MSIGARLSFVLLLGLGCERAPPPPDPAAPPAPAAAPASTADNPAELQEVVTFRGAPAWSGGRSCTDVRPEDGCDSQWLHASGQVVRVFVIDVKEERALDAFVERLAADVGSKGGVVDRFTQNGLTLVRFLQRVPLDPGAPGEPGDGLASLNYALVGRDKKAVHLMTSIVPFEEQQVSDARMRELLSFSAWAPR